MKEEASVNRIRSKFAFATNKKSGPKVRTLWEVNTDSSSERHWRLLPGFTSATVPYSLPNLDKIFSRLR